MAEPSSLYARFTISQAARHDFLTAKIASFAPYKDWWSWLQTQAYAGSLTSEQIASMDYGNLRVDEYLSHWLQHPLALGVDAFDPETQTWIISMYEFSENYLEYISFLNVLRNLEHFIDTHVKGFVLVYPYLWQGLTAEDTELDAILSMGRAYSEILQKAPVSWITESTAHFHERERLSASKS